MLEPEPAPEGGLRGGLDPGRLIGVGACEQAGTIVCDGTATTKCSAVAGLPTTELCEGINNDCDANTDETYPELGDPCMAGVGACEQAGTIVCDVPVATTCDAIPGSPTAELCDGINNDCDANTDEGFGLGMPCDGPDADQCAEGVIVCADLGAGCNDTTDDTCTAPIDGGIDAPVAGRLHPYENHGCASTRRASAWLAFLSLWLVASSVRARRSKRQRRVGRV